MKRTPPPAYPDLLQAVAAIGARAAEMAPASLRATGFDDSDDFLLSTRPFAHDIYLIDMVQAGMTALELIGLIRRRAAAGIIAISHAAGADFAPALHAGADQLLAAEAPREHLLAAIAAIRRRQQAPRVAAADTAWVLFEGRQLLQAPSGARMALSDSELTIMKCFAEQARVERAQLVEALWGSGAQGMDNALHATMYRLRKRIEQFGQTTPPVHAVSKVGYEFRAALARK